MKTETKSLWVVRKDGRTVATNLSVEVARAYCQDLRDLFPASNVVMLWNI